MYTRTVPKVIKDMLLSIAEKNDLPYGLVEDIYYHEFEFVANEIKKGESFNYDTYNNILLKHFGSFIANEKHIKKVREIFDDRKLCKGE